MALVPQDALRRYKAGDFSGIVRDHDPSNDNRIKEQNLFLILAQSHIKLGNPRDAARYYRLAGSMKGTNQAAFLQIASNLYLENGAVGEAFATATMLRTVDPTNPKAHDIFYRALQETCLYDTIEAENAALLARLKQGDLLARMSDSPFNHVAWCADEAVNASLIVPSIKHPVNPTMQRLRRARPHRWGEKLRIGYLSNDFCDHHPMMRLFQGVMVSHDISRFDVTYFCFTSAKHIALDSGNRQHYPNLVPIGHMDDEQAAEFIRSREIDILVDLKGHTSGCRPDLINLGLAPVQVAHHGFAGSGNGIDCDYVLSDRFTTPSASIPHYHEKLCRLPESYQPNDTIFRPRPIPVRRKDLGLPEDKVILGFFNATRKFTPETFRLTMEILKRTENSVLWILFFNDFARDNFLNAAAREGIDPARIIQAPKTRYADHLARLPAADIALDTFPFNGHTTTSDALWAGVPVPTFKGTHFASRVSESLLNALGVPELVAENAQGYVDLCCALATDRERRSVLRARIDAARHVEPLFDTARFARHLERAFEMMADRAKNGLDPDHIDVPALPR